MKRSLILVAALMFFAVVFSSISASAYTTTSVQGGTGPCGGRVLQDDWEQGQM